MQIARFLQQIATYGNMLITSKVCYQYMVLLYIYHEKLTFYIFLLLQHILKYLIISENLSGITVNDILCMSVLKSCIG